VKNTIICINLALATHSIVFSYEVHCTVSD
jgi:hypothetical protein